jgi:hypothetical protein
MAYATSNPPALIAQRIGGGGGVWRYDSTDPNTTVRGANYITNGGDLGLKVADTVVGTDTDTSTNQHLYVVNAAGNGTTDLTDGQAVSGTDTD